MEFIEITERNGNIRVLLPLSKILSISQNKDLTAFIETGVDAKGNSTGVFAKELFVEIWRKLDNLKGIIKGEI